MTSNSPAKIDNDEEGSINLNSMAWINSKTRLAGKCSATGSKSDSREKKKNNNKKKTNLTPITQHFPPSNLSINCSTSSSSSSPSSPSSTTGTAKMTHHPPPPLPLHPDPLTQTAPPHPPLSTYPPASIPQPPELTVPLKDYNLLDLTDMLAMDDVASIYPKPSRRGHFDHILETLCIKKSNIPNGGRGVFTKAPITKGTILGIYSGTVSSTITHYSMTLVSKSYTYGKMDYNQRDFCVDGTPTGALDETTLALLNDFIWSDDSTSNLMNNVKIEPMGIFTARRNIKTNEELCCDYGRAYNWDHQKFYVCQEIIPLILQAQQHLCNDVFRKETLLLSSQIKEWALNPNPSPTNLCSQLFEVVSTKISPLHQTPLPPRRSWNEGLKDSFEVWLPKLLSWKTFADTVWYRSYGNPLYPTPNLQELLPEPTVHRSLSHRRNWSTSQLMEELRVCKDVQNDHLLTVVSNPSTTPQSSLTRLFLSLSPGNQDRALYNKLRNLALRTLNLNENVDHFIRAVCTSNIACFNWHREFNNGYSNETESNGLCGWLALEQLSRRDSWKVPKCLEVGKKADHDKMVLFLNNLKEAPPSLDGKLRNIISLMKTKFGTAPHDLWLNDEDMSALANLTPHPTGWWHKEEGLCRVHSTHHGGLLTWTEISNISRLGRHIGLDPPHFFLLKWNSNEIDLLTEHMEDMLRQVYLNILATNNPSPPPTPTTLGSLRLAGAMEPVDLAGSSSLPPSPLIPLTPPHTTQSPPHTLSPLAVPYIPHNSPSPSTQPPPSLMSIVRPPPRLDLKPDTLQERPLKGGEDKWRSSTGFISSTTEAILLDPPKIAQLRCAFFNINTLTVAKLQDILFYFRTWHLDVLVLLDTRVTARTTGLFKYICDKEMINYPLGWTSHFANAKISRRGNGCVGGQLWMVNNRLQNLRFNELILNGAVVELSAKFGNRWVSILGNYWPCQPRQLSEGNSLWNQLRILYQSDRPINMIKDTILKRLSQLKEDRILILGGDFNSDVNTSDTFKLRDFAQDNDLLLGKEADLKQPSFSRAGHSNRLDYIMTSGNCSTALNLPVDPLEHSEDHIPVICILRASGADARPQKKATVLIRNIINRKDPRTIIGMETFLKCNNIDDSEPSSFIDSFSAATAEAAGSAYIRGNKQKDGWSVIAQALHINLRMIIIIRRHTDGINRSNCKQWRATSFIKGLKGVLKKWRSCISSLARDNNDRSTLYDFSTYGYTYWLNASWASILTTSHPAYSHVRSLLHGRKRKEYRILQGKRTAAIEKARETGSIGRAIRSLQDPSPKFNMQELKIDDELVTDPHVIAEAVMDNFIKWFKSTVDPLAGTVGTDGLDTEPLETDADSFVQANLHTNIPPHLLYHLHKHLQPKTIDADKLAEFRKMVLESPSLDEFNACILRLPDRSAPGLSGLNYDCIKLWDMDTKIKVLKALNALWADKKVPTSWLWKWLVPLPKCPNPKLSDLRPLVLIEALRKVWVGIFTYRINIFLTKNSVLCSNQHGFIWGRSVESASLILMNALETACEWRTNLFISSWDIKRAFDSVPYRMLLWSLTRIGVPVQLAKYLVLMDVEGKMVVRSPLAMAIHKKEGTKGLEEAGLVFTAGKGTGQGDKLSPLVWNAFCDVLLAALEDTTGGDFFTQDHTGENRRTPDVAYADDIVSMKAAMEALQHRADIISAFAILMNMELAIPKLRVFGIEWGNPYRNNTKVLKVHTPGWTCTEVPVKQDGELKHLGILWSMDLFNSMDLEAAKSLLKNWSTAVKRSKLSAASKKTALESSIFQKIIYRGKFSPWTAEQLAALDKTVEVLLRKIFKCSYGAPTSLFYIDKAQGGYGCKQLSDEINKARLAFMWRMLSTRGDTSHAITSCISRGFRAAGQNISEPEKQRMEPPLADRWWISNVRDYLQSLDISLIRNGEPYPLQPADTWAGKDLPLESRCTLNQAGIHSLAECGGPDDQPPLIIDGLNISDIGNTPANIPIPLRTGQCWLVGTVIWEILGFRDGQVEAFNWKPKSTIMTGQEVHIMGNDFSSGSGGGTLLSPDIFTYKWDTALMTLGPETHHPDGSTTSRIMAIRPRSARTRVLTIPPRETFTDLTANLPPQVRDIFTDGSWAQSGTAADWILGTNYTKTYGAIVLEQDTGSVPEYYGIRIIGSSPHTKSAYTLELLSILGATYIARGLNISGCVRSDCKAAINTCFSAWKGRPAIRKYPLLGYIAARMPSWPILHIKAHPERHSRDKEWSSADCGIYVADCTAGGEATTTKRGILDSDLLNELTRHLPFLILDLAGEHVLEDLHDRRQRILVNKYLSNRDKFRSLDTQDPRPIKWAGMRPALMSSMTGLKKTGANMISRTIKAAWDWFYTGSNRKKGNPLADTSCTLCNCYEDQKHIILKCPHPELKFLRNGILNGFRESITLETSNTVQGVCRKLLLLIESDPSGYQLLIGLLDPQLRLTIREQLSYHISGSEWNSTLKLLKEAGKSTIALILTHLKLSAIKISGKSPTMGLFRTNYGIQKSLDSYYEADPSDPAIAAPDPPSPQIDVMATVREHWPDPLSSEDEPDFNPKYPHKRHHSAIYDDEDLKTTLIRGPGTWKARRDSSLLKSNRSFTKDIQRRKRSRDE